MVVGFTSVVGDLFHAGHIRMIEECKEHCDYLIVGIICDPSDRKEKNKPIESVYERYYRISRCKGVDKVVPLENEADLKLFLEMSSNIDIRFVGDDYIGKEFTGKDVWEIKRDPVMEYVHPTQKPVALSAKALHNSSKKGDIVLDLFGGSGSTLMGCEQLGRKARIMEFDPKYVDVIIERWENFTGEKAVKIEGE